MCRPPGTPPKYLQLMLQSSGDLPTPVHAHFCFAITNLNLSPVMTRCACAGPLMRGHGCARVNPRTGRLHEDLTPHAVLHVIAEQDQLLRRVAHAARVCGKHRVRQRLRARQMMLIVRPLLLTRQRPCISACHNVHPRMADIVSKDSPHGGQPSAKATAAVAAAHVLDPRLQGRAQIRTCSPPAAAGK